MDENNIFYVERMFIGSRLESLKLALIYSFNKIEKYKLYIHAFSCDAFVSG